MGRPTRDLGGTYGHIGTAMESSMGRMGLKMMSKFLSGNSKLKQTLQNGRYFLIMTHSIHLFNRFNSRLCKYIYIYKPIRATRLGGHPNGPSHSLSLHPLRGVSRSGRGGSNDPRSRTRSAAGERVGCVEDQ